MSIVELGSFVRKDNKSSRDGTGGVEGDKSKRGSSLKSQQVGGSYLSDDEDEDGDKVFAKQNAVTDQALFRKV